jgi:PKD repeat protein
MKKILIASMLLWFTNCKNVIEDEPKANFYATNKEGGDVLFQDASTNSDSNFWDLGDKTYTNEKGILYTFKKNGLFTVSLIASNKNGKSDRIVKSIKVENALSTLNFYKKFNGTGQNNIKVYFDDSKNIFGEINGKYYYTSSPGCGVQNTVSVYNLKEGYYNYKCVEYNTGVYWEGSVYVKSGVCHSIGLTKN